MFSAALEIVLTIAYREAVARKHAYLTLEHLLYALAHDQEGERILAACGADLTRLRKDLNDYLETSVPALVRLMANRDIGDHFPRKKGSGRVKSFLQKGPPTEKKSPPL